MGVVADAVLEAGGEVIGVIPQQLVDRELAHRGLTDLRVVGSMHERKALMADARRRVRRAARRLRHARRADRDHHLAPARAAREADRAARRGAVLAAVHGPRRAPPRAAGFLRVDPGEILLRRRRRATAGTAGLMLVAPWTSRFHGTGMEAGPGCRRRGPRRPRSRPCPSSRAVRRSTRSPPSPAVARPSPACRWRCSASAR